MRLDRDFFRQNSYQLAKALLGKVLVFKNKKYRIVETEAYLGITDKAAHSYNNKKTPRTKTMYLDGGHLYVYFIYGMYYMLNIVANQVEVPEAVLIRAIAPIDDDMIRTNGPGKLCKALGIDKKYDGKDLCNNEIIYVIDDHYQPIEIVCTKRINIDYAKEDKDRLYRFYLKGNPYVSKQ